jgi:prolyl 4-hydroxylase
MINPKHPVQRNPKASSKAHGNNLLSPSLLVPRVALAVLAVLAALAAFWKNEFHVPYSLTQVGTQLSQVCESNHNYTTTILSQSPLMLYINNFVSQSEAEYLRQLGEASFRPSEISWDGGVKDEKSNLRTSLSTGLPIDDPVVQCVGQRAITFQGASFNTTDFGSPQLVKYGQGQKFDLHYDWFPRAGMLQADGSRQIVEKNRVTSFFVILEADGIEEGSGGTWFPRVPIPELLRGSSVFTEKRLETGEADGLVSLPIAGNAIFWANLHEDGQGDERTLHAGLPLVGERARKVGMNIWTKIPM